jgi:hypothetical protein
MTEPAPLDPDPTDPLSQLPAIIPPAALATSTSAEPPADLHLVPALIADAGDAAGWRYVEFFTANIRNPHTRPRTRGRAAGSSPGAKTAAWR